MVFRILKYLTTVLLVLLVILAVYIFLNFICHGDNDLKIFGILFSIVSSSIGILFVSLTYFSNRESIERTQVEKYFSYLNSDISDALYGDKKGVDAYLAYDMGKDLPKNVILDNLNLVLNSFETYLDLIDNNKLISESFKKFSRTRLHLLFYSKVLWPLHATMGEHGKMYIAGKHDDSKMTIPKFAKIGINSIQYLIDNNLAQDSKYKNENMQFLRELLTNSA